MKVCTDCIKCSGDRLYVMSARYGVAENGKCYLRGSSCRLQVYWKLQADTTDCSSSGVTGQGRAISQRSCKMVTTRPCDVTNSYVQFEDIRKSFDAAGLKLDIAEVNVSVCTRSNQTWNSGPLESFKFIYTLLRAKVSNRDKFRRIAA